MSEFKHTAEIFLEDAKKGILRRAPLEIKELLNRHGRNSIEMWEYVIGGHGFRIHRRSFLVYNGRATRREITRVIVEEERRTQEILREHGKLLGKLSEQHSTMVDMLRSIGAVRPAGPRPLDEGKEEGKAPAMELSLFNN